MRPRCEAINAGWIAGAGIDVYSREPVPIDSPLLALDPDRVLLTATTYRARRPRGRPAWTR
jgi:phosphoglycerate dehydrogenase-like enzyme